MITLKLKELMMKKDCPLKSNLRYQMDMSCENKLLQRKFKIREIFLNDDIKSIEQLHKLSEDDLDDVFDEYLFDSEKEKDVFLKNVVNKIEKFCLNMYSYSSWDMIKKQHGIVTIDKKDIELSLDMVFENSNEVFAIKILDKEAKIKNRGKTDATQSSKSLELYCMYKLCQKLYPGKKVKVALVHLNEKTSLNYFATRDSENMEDVVYFTELIKDIENIDDFKECEECTKSCEFYPICSYTHSLEEYKAVEVEESLIKERELPVINFSEEQQKVIEFDDGYGVVNAVAGAGKTTVLSKRIERLIKVKNCSVDDIVVISFSEKTIDEFKEKLTEKFGIDNFENVYTFNGFGDKLIKEEYSLFGFSKRPKLMDEMTKYEIIKEVIDSTNIITELEEINQIWENPKGMIVKRLNYEMMFPSGGFGIPLIYQIRDIFDYIKKQGIYYTSSEFIEDEYTKFAQEVVANKRLTGEERTRVLYLYKKFLNKIYSQKNGMYNKYHYILKDRGYYDYTDQINCLVSSFSNPRLKRRFKYKHVICDEFQDSNDSAMLVLKKLTMNENFESLLVVGDVNQSIYGFQGATPENLIRFDKYFPGEEVKNFDISYSYRVPKIVAKKANALMEHSLSVKYNKMNAFKDLEGQSGKINSKKELIGIIKKSIENEKTVGIIARNNDDLNDFISLLVKNDIPYAVKSNLYIMKKPKIVNLNNLYKVLINPTENRMEFLKYLMIVDNDVFESKFKTKEFDKYFESKYEDLLDKIDSKTPVELLDIYYQMIEPLAKKDYMIETYLDNIKKVHPKSIEDVKNHCYKLQMYTPTIKVPENNLETNVILTTGHSSKGREFDVVIMDVSTFSAMGEEDRRLFYVSMTRAKEAIFFINLKRRISVSKKKSCKQYIDIIDAVN